MTLELTEEQVHTATEEAREYNANNQATFWSYVNRFAALWVAGETHVTIDRSTLAFVMLAAHRLAQWLQAAKDKPVVCAWCGTPAKSLEALRPHSAECTASPHFAELTALRAQTFLTPAPAGPTVRIDYTNHRGERAWRTIRPMELLYAGEPAHGHTTTGYRLRAYDFERKALRHFDVAQIHAWAGLADQPAAAGTETP